jgi:hypothetical protein
MPAPPSAQRLQVGRSIALSIPLVNPASPRHRRRSDRPRYFLPGGRPLSRRQTQSDGLRSSRPRDNSDNDGRDSEPVHRHRLPRRSVLQRNPRMTFQAYLRLCLRRTETYRRTETHHEAQHGTGLASTGRGFAVRKHPRGSKVLPACPRTLHAEGGQAFGLVTHGVSATYSS